MTAALLLFAMLSFDGAWPDFAHWFSREGTPGTPADVLKAYTAVLQSKGVAAAEVTARIAEIQAHMKDHPRDALILHFDRIFTWKDAPFTREPSALVRRIASTRSPGRALDIAMGQGRNSLLLARAGWSVSGYDFSPEALRQAQAAAQAEGLKLDTRLAAHDEYSLGVAQWDLIVMCYAFTRLSDTAYMQRVRDSLKPGGVLIVEGFNGPRPELNMILKAFLDYRVLLFEDLPDLADWGRMKAPLLRMALEKP